MLPTIRHCLQVIQRCLRASGRCLQGPGRCLRAPGRCLRAPGRCLRVVRDWAPVTLRSVLLAVVLILAMRFIALPHHDRILFAAAASGLFTQVILAFTTLISAIWLRLTRLPYASSVEIASTVRETTGLRIPFLGWLPFLQVESTWIDHAQVQAELAWNRGALEEFVICRERMETDRVRRKLTVSDVFGLSRVSFVRSLPQRIHVEPLPAAVTDVAQIRKAQHGEDMSHPHGQPKGDLMEMRNYQPGDPLKLVLWKHFVRSGQLLVRLPEPAISTANEMLACFVCGDGDEASAGVACSVLAHAQQRNEQFAFMADGSTATTDSADEAIAQIIRSVHVRDSGGQVLSSMHSEIGQSPSTNCLLFVPSQPGPWLERVIAQTKQYGWQAAAVIGVDQVSQRPPRTGWRRWLVRWKSPEQTTIDQIRAVVDLLLEAGISSTIYQRTTGDAMSIAALEVQVSQ